MAKSSQTNPPTGRLIALNPADPGLREFVLHKDQVLVGSAPTDDLVISDGTVSRHHASVTNREGRYELADLNSTNGTFVNGQRLAGSTWIDKGDDIRFGEARFVFSSSGAALAPATAKPARLAGMRTHVLLGALAAILGGVSGFVGGVAATSHVETTIVAKRLVIVDDSGKPRALIAVLPEPGAMPSCTACDGRAHLIVTDQQGRQMMWPPTGPQLSPADLTAIIKFLMMIAK